MDFEEMLNAQFKGMNKNKIRYAKADVEEPVQPVHQVREEEEDGLGGAKPAKDRDLQYAFENAMPVEGKVAKEIKGGWEVTVKGQRAFCPFSQMELRRKEGVDYKDQNFLFVITEYSVDERGPNLVVSRRVLLEKEAAEQKRVALEALTEGQTVNGVVVKVLDFGAFVDLGGVEGLVPVREISWDRVVTPRDYLKEGDNVTVQVLSIDAERDRISLSIRATTPKRAKPLTDEEKAAQEEAANVNDYLSAHAGESDVFSNLSTAFDGIKL